MTTAHIVRTSARSPARRFICEGADMTIFYDADKAVADFRASMAVVINSVTDPDMAAQLRSVDVQAEFVRWIVTEMNLGTEQDDIVHATAALLTNLITNTIANTDLEHGSTLLSRLFNMLENNTGHTVSETQIDKLVGGNA